MAKAEGEQSEIILRRAADVLAACTEQQRAQERRALRKRISNSNSSAKGLGTKKKALNASAQHRIRYRTRAEWWVK